jgi:hypothetical protein
MEINPMNDLFELSFCSYLDKESRKPGKRTRSINASRNIMDIGLSVTINTLLGEIKKRGLSQDSKR